MERAVPKVTQTLKETVFFLTHDTKRHIREVLFWVIETKRDHAATSYRTTLMAHKSDLWYVGL